jgi:hypothetical protein
MAVSQSMTRSLSGSILVMYADCDPRLPME